MKKLAKLFTVLAIVMFTSNTFAEGLGLKMSNLNLYAPAAKSKGSSGSGGIEKGTMQLDVSFNLGAHTPFLGRGGYGYGYVGVGFVPGATINFDYAVHPYASVGAYLGFGGRYHYSTLGVGVRGVFHIYQLISDKANTKVDPGKLDFYFPFHIGGIITFYNNKYYSTSKKAYGGATAGGGLGVRYYFAKNIGIMAEVGWLEMSVAKVGFSFKF